MISTNKEKLIPYIIENINVGMVGDISWYATIKMIFELYPDLEWDELISDIDTRLRDITIPKPSQVELYIHIIYLMKKNQY